MIFCNTISLQSNSHGFPSSGGGGGDSLPNSQTYAYYLPPENILHLPKVPSSPTK